jgi:DNA-binding MarR family transcriptional regulator
MKQKKIKAIGDLLKMMSTHSTLRSTLIANKLQINTTDLECLEILMRLGKTTAGVLSEETKLTTGAVTKMIDRLEKVGFIKRHFEKSDRRKVFIELEMKAVSKKVMPLYMSLGIEIANKLNKYSESQLELIIDFLSSSIKISEVDLQKLSES